MNPEKLFIATYTNWDDTIEKLLSAANFENLLESGRPALLKPNLVSDDPPPITTPVGIVEAIVKYIKKHRPDIKIIVAEGCGIKSYDTWTPFRKLGYVEMAEKHGVELIDLNEAPLTTMRNPRCSRWPEFHMPEIVMSSFLVSVPVLKAHSIADVTLTMKNMMGAAPPKFYDAGTWKKSAFHSRVHEAVLDMNRYRTPDFTVLDATEGMSEAHLWGPSCDPPPNQIVACADPIAIDAYGAEILGFDWRQIDHISGANGELGRAETYDRIFL